MAFSEYGEAVTELAKGFDVSTPAVILGSHANALTFARALGRRGVPVWIADSERALGRYTRYAKVISLPHVEQEPQRWLDALMELGARFGTSVLFSTTDAHCLWLAEHKGELCKYFRFLSPDLAATERIIFKDRQYAAACAAQLSAPRTVLLEDENAAEVAAEFVYPCILKPNISHRGRKRLGGAKVVLVHSARELIETYRRVALPSVQFVAQEIVRGGDDAIYIYAGFRDELAQERAFATFHKMRQFPPHFGTGSFFETASEPRVSEYARRLLKELQYTGLLEIEFKLDVRAQDFFLIEMNPRAGTTSVVAETAGVDLGWLTYLYLSGNRLPAPAPVRNGIRVMDEEMDVLAFMALAQAGELSAGEWLRTVRGAKPVIAAWDDPMPLLVGIGRGVKRLLT